MITLIVVFRSWKANKLGRAMCSILQIPKEDADKQLIKSAKEIIQKKEVTSNVQQYICTGKILNELKNQTFLIFYK